MDTQFAAMAFQELQPHQEAVIAQAACLVASSAS